MFPAVKLVFDKAVNYGISSAIFPKSYYKDILTALLELDVNGFTVKLDLDDQCYLFFMKHKVDFNLAETV